MLSRFSDVALARFLGAIAISGILFLWPGIWPPRRGSERRCRKCGYVVDNISSARCPECGSILSGRGTVVGHRTRRMWIWWPGALLLLGALGIGGVEMYRRVDWYHYKPVRWVFKDLEARDGVKEERAWSELLKRKDARSLSRYWEEHLADVALRDHWQWANLPAPQRQPVIARQRGEESIALLWDQYEAGRLTPSQEQTFFQHLVAASWVVRPVVAVGQDAPCHFAGERYLPDKGWWMKFHYLGQGGDGFTMLGGGMQGAHVGIGFNAPASARTMPGEHEVQIYYSMEFYRGDHSGYAQAKMAKPIRIEEFVHRARVKVVEKTSPEYVEMVDAPELAGQIKASFSIDQFGYYPPADYFQVEISAKAVPMNVAFELFARIDGVERKMSELTFRKGGGGGAGGSGFAIERFKPKKVDLIFRSSADVAGRSVDLFKVWKGEIEFKDVPVSNPKQ